MRFGTAIAAVLAASAGSLIPQSPPQKFVPLPIRASDLTVRLDRIGRMPTHANPTSPAVAGPHLLLIDQTATIYVWNGDRAESVLAPADIPRDVRPVGHERILNVAANESGSRVFVVFVSSTAPAKVPRWKPVRDGSDGWYVLCEYAFDGRRLTSPRPFAALGMRTDGHTGGGLVVLGDDALLFAVGDNGDSYEDGWDYSQNPTVHPAKILRFDPATGSALVVAVGVRTPQRLVLSGTGADARLSFVDPGGWVADELNSIRVVDLPASGPPANFGWGRHPVDRKSREGNFHISRVGDSLAPIPTAETGFVEPLAEFGREGRALVAASGPVLSARSFSRISMLFGDLVSGSVLAITEPATTPRQAVHRVNLVDREGQPVTLVQLAGGGRPDPRFFNFPDGTAGVLIERTGEFYRLTEVK